MDYFKGSYMLTTNNMNRDVWIAVTGLTPWRGYFELSVKSYIINLCTTMYRVHCIPYLINLSLILALYLLTLSLNFIS